MSQHTLLIRCPTWEHLENLYTKKIKPGNVLVARVPFCPGKGSTIHITIELPDQSRKVLESTVEGVRPAPDARKSSLKLKVHGLTSAVRTSFEKKVAAQRKQQDADAPRTMPRQKPGTSLEPPAPIPADVPIREPVFTPGVPSTISSTAGAVCQEQFRLLKKERARLRELAAHDVLGVSRDTDVIGIRQAYFAMTKRFHPDRLARYECAEVSALASELFIHINQAYDRLRQGAIAAGKAILAGPALLPHEGWIASFSDIGTLKPRPPLSNDDLRIPTKSNRSIDSSLKDESAASLDTKNLFEDARQTASGMQPIRETPRERHAMALVQTAERLTQEGIDLLDSEMVEAARAKFAEALTLAPRNRILRALYHVAYGKTLVLREEPVRARTQFEAALAHDPSCEAAKAAILAVRPRAKRPSLFQRMFRS